ncbi:hypothetical protein NW759_015483 [Fusarium solani]|nr:hypothetical protein NW759_015483 [Fusarium solani]
MSSGEEGSSGSSAEDKANRLALGAIVIASVAFIVAFLQFVLEYFASSEARSKYTYEAIGPSAKHVKFRPNWRFFKLRVKYPLLDLSFSKVFTAVCTSELLAIDSLKSPLRRVCEDKPHWGWQVMGETDNHSFNMVSKDLTWRLYFILIWWKITHTWKPMVRPRASWAQLLTAFGNRDTSSLVYRHADADVIPSSIGAPIQRAKLFDLGIIALQLGFKKVTIDTRNRRFTAVSDFGTIKTLKLDELGKVIRFEGDILAIYHQISKGSFVSKVIGRTGSASNGRLSFGLKYTTNGMFYPLKLISTALSQRWDQNRFDEEQTEFIVRRLEEQKGCIIKGEVSAEASLLETLLADADFEVDQPADPGNDQASDDSSEERSEDSEDFEPKELQKTTTGLSAKHLGNLLGVWSQKSRAKERTAFVQWQRATGLDLPTILAALTIASLGSCEVGFPSGIILYPFAAFLNAIAQQIGSTLRPLNVDSEITRLFALDRLQFVRSKDTFWYSFNYVGMSPRYFLWSWMFQETKEVFDTLDEKEQDKIVIRQDGQHTGDVNIVLFSDCDSLLHNFKPRDWSAKIERIIALSMVKYRPVNMVWAQILILDIAIHFLVRGGWYEGPIEGYNVATDEVAAVVAAVVDSWQGTDTEAESETPAVPLAAISDPAGGRQGHKGGNQERQHGTVHGSVAAAGQHGSGNHGTTDNADRHQHTDTHPMEPKIVWDLVGSLKKQPNLFRTLQSELRQERLRKLASLLQLRTIFYAAFLMLNPDSSDVYRAESSSVEMPII